MDTFSLQRESMVKRQIERRGITDTRVLEAMRMVPRHLFFPRPDAFDAYADSPAPIGFGQTISQPYIVALMTSLLQLSPTDTILEIGTGSGYQAAVLSSLVNRVVSLEINPYLAERAANTLRWLHFDNVQVFACDGSSGYPAFQPYQGILVTACAPVTPQPLLEQLDSEAHLVLPVEERGGQRLRIWKKDASGHLGYTDHIPVAFVPLRGKFGYQIAP